MRYGISLITSLSLVVASAVAMAQNIGPKIEPDRAGGGGAGENRVALIIGNGAYKESPLFNPVNDASDLATALEKRGFRVLLRENVGERGLKEAVDQFASYLKRGGVGLFFFAGHGVQINGQNYLVPVDVSFTSEAEVSYKAVAAEYVLARRAEAGNRANIVVLDACRDNPFQPARSAKKGLAQMSVGRNEKGTYIAYATSPGSTASDGQGRNGVYTNHLLRSLDESDSDIDKVFGRVRAWVVQDTDGTQVPWTTTSLIDNFYFDPKESLLAMRRPAAAPVIRQEPVAVSRPYDAAAEREFWARVEHSQNSQDYRTYLDKFPSGPNAAFARFRLKRFEGAAQTALGSAPGTVPGASERQRPAAAASAPQIAATPAAGTSPQLAVLAPPREPASLALPALPKAAAQTDVLPPGAVFRDCAECPELITVTPGQFVMGMAPGSPGYDPDAGPAHTVRIGSAYAVGKFEVTRAQFAAFVRDAAYTVRAKGCNTIRGGRFHLDPRANWQSPGFAQTDSDPVVCVSWNDAKAYVGWLSRKSGKSYRLPSEAEWEFAARGGSDTMQYWPEGVASACRHASIADQSITKAVPGVKGFPCADGHEFTAPVGRFLPNQFGLYDMLGNVWEWTEDCWNEGYKGAPADGSSWIQGACTERVFRGGSWSSKPAVVHTAYRDRENVDDRHDNLGFRVARPLP